jgi:formate dehydrogenase beta subunit
MLAALLAIGGIGLVAGLGLAAASKIFYVYVDPQIVAIEESLPGANCGGCGFPGCSGAAAAIASGSAPPNICVGGGSDVHAKVAAIMGVEVQEKEPEIARPGCTYGVERADLKYFYNGVNDCRAALLLDGGSKVCPIGCLGLGTCAAACPFGAISMGPDNLPVVNQKLCTGCGTCERVCPKHIITLSSHSERIQREYTTAQCSAPCQRACPAGIDIPAYIREIAEGRPLDAVRIIKETNPFPSVCGRICVHPCEPECRRNLVDEPVAINPLKRFAADYEMNAGERVQIPRAPKTGKRVAVVGGGAEGLTAAYFLNRMGHDSAVFEGKPVLGGLLRTGLPENRLPKDVLDWEIQGILDAGVEVQTDRKLGRDFTLESLFRDGFSAVFVATGGWDTQFSARMQGGATELLPGVQLLIDFIMSQRAGDMPSKGKHVMILGGGNAALEAALACLKEQAKSVTMILRESRERAPFSLDELKKAEELGVHFRFESALTAMLGEDNRLERAEIVHLSAQGKEEGLREVLDLDIMVTGAGRFPELMYVKRAGSSEPSETTQERIRWQTLFPYASPFAKEDIGIFRPGEVTGDYKAVVEAIGSGRRAANSIQRFLTGKPVEAPERMIRKYTQVLNVSEVEPITTSPRQKEPERPTEERIADPCAEIVLGYSQDQALTEAKRCLQCGLICYRRMEGFENA